MEYLEKRSRWKNAKRVGNRYEDDLTTPAQALFPVEGEFQVKYIKNIISYFSFLPTPFPSHTLCSCSHQVFFWVFSVFFYKNSVPLLFRLPRLIIQLFLQLIGTFSPLFLHFMYSSQLPPVFL